MHTSPELEVLLLCARPRLSDTAAARLHTLAQQAPDWATILDLADEYRTTPLLARHLRDHADIQLDDNIRADLQQHHLETARHNLVLAAEVVRLVALFSAQGVAAIPFKGPVFAMLVHGDLSMRACGDIDLLVKQHDHARARQLLEGAGYQFVQRYENAMQSGLRHEQRQTSVDLHWGIPPASLGLRSAPLWQDIRSVTLLDQAVPTFSPRDSLLIMAVNTVKEYWKPSLHQLSDIVALTRDYSEEDWVAAFQRAREIGCARILAVALLLAQRLLDSPLPCAGPLHLFRNKRIHRAVDELADHLFIREESHDTGEAMKLFHHRRAHAYYLTLTDSARQRLHDWLEWAGTPNREDESFIRLPGKLAFLYFLIRPLRLLLKRL